MSFIIKIGIYKLLEFQFPMEVRLKKALKYKK